MKKLLLLGVALFVSACEDPVATCIQRIDYTVADEYQNEAVREVCDSDKVQILALSGRLQNGLNNWQKTTFSCVFEKDTSAATIFGADVAKTLLEMPKQKRQLLCDNFVHANPILNPQQKNRYLTVLDEVAVMSLNIKGQFQGKFTARLSDDINVQKSIVPASVTYRGSHLVNQDGYTIDLAGHDTYFTITYAGLSAKVCAQLWGDFGKLEGIYNATVSHSTDCTTCENNTCKITFFGK